MVLFTLFSSFSLKINLKFKVNPQMLLKISLGDIIAIENQRAMCCLFLISTKNVFLSLLATIRIETHFRLVAESLIFFKSLFSSLTDALMPWVSKKKDVSFDDKFH